MGPNIKDALLIQTKALPNGAASVTSDGLQIHDNTAQGVFPGNVEAVIEAPALNATALPASKTMTYSVETSDTANFAVATAVGPTLVQTGAAAVAATLRVRLPSNCGKYVRAKATGSASGDASGVSLELSLRV